MVRWFQHRAKLQISKFKCQMNVKVQMPNIVDIWTLDLIWTWFTFSSSLRANFGIWYFRSPRMLRELDREYVQPHRCPCHMRFWRGGAEDCECPGGRASSRLRQPYLPHSLYLSMGGKNLGRKRMVIDHQDAKRQILGVGEKSKVPSLLLRSWNHQPSDRGRFFGLSGLDQRQHEITIKGSRIQGLKGSSNNQKTNTKDRNRIQDWMIKIKPPNA